jgi:hypothetical protein
MKHQSGIQKQKNYLQVYKYIYVTMAVEVQNKKKNS